MYVALQSICNFCIKLKSWQYDNTEHDCANFRGKPLFLSNKTTVKQQLNGDK